LKLVFSFLTATVNNRRRIGALWVLFAMIFASLATYHWFESRAQILPMPMPKREGGDTIKVRDIDLDALLRDFVNEVNRYVKEENEASHRQNVLACLGYVVASLTALFSAVLEFLPRKAHLIGQTRRPRPVARLPRRRA